ncbi:Trafficking protein particle complex subunit 10 [Cytospora mali]|uniref:Trafficking protein particle complex subunit 10 n=1 Tax=Cytospora mali TaxID=578113 RepID=A0A194VQ84_CYTMA|nr:Trafficking protein particle complex subunit 10 [Valsa mali]
MTTGLAGGTPKRDSNTSDSTSSDLNKRRGLCGALDTVKREKSAVCLKTSCTLTPSFRASDMDGVLDSVNVPLSVVNLISTLADTLGTSCSVVKGIRILTEDPAAIDENEKRPGSGDVGFCCSPSKILASAVRRRKPPVAERMRISQVCTSFHPVVSSRSMAKFWSSCTTVAGSTCKSSVSARWYKTTNGFLKLTALWSKGWNAFLSKLSRSGPLLSWTRSTSHMPGLMALLRTWILFRPGLSSRSSVFSSQISRDPPAATRRTIALSTGRGSARTLRSLSVKQKLSWPSSYTGVPSSSMFVKKFRSECLTSLLKDLAATKKSGRKPLKASLSGYSLSTIWPSLIELVS